MYALLYTSEVMGLGRNHYFLRITQMEYWLCPSHACVGQYIIVIWRYLYLSFECLPLNRKSCEL